MPDPAVGSKRKFGEASVLDEWADVNRGGEGAFEQEHVHRVYEAIAPHFSSTRYKAWPKVAEFVNSQPPGSFVLDVGCGNGKSLAGVEGGRVLMGCDTSPSLLAFAATRGIDCQVANALTLPHRSCCFDAVISIAMLHHLSTDARRTAALSEMVRVLRPGGRLLVYVWAAGQKRFHDAPTQDVTVPWTLHERFRPGTQKGRQPPAEAKEKKGEEAQPPSSVAGAGESGVSGGPGPAGEAGHVHARYYHLFAEGELEALLAEVGGVSVCTRYYDSDNWCVIAEKTLSAEAAASCTGAQAEGCVASVPA